MLISKFNLYKSEWLELVFDNRNKEYGAYYLRQHYAGNMTKAMGITFLTIGLIIGGSMILRTDKPVDPAPRYIEHKVILPPPIKIEPPAPPRHVRVEPPPPPAAATRFVQLVVTDDRHAQEPPKNDEIKGAIGPETIKGPIVGPTVIPVETPTGTGGKPDDSVHPLNGVDVMPEPVGGSAAWAKFLNKNLRFPYEAQTDGVSGRVSLSFIIEKDGHLSNISVSQAAGHGFDEEAMRVLKMAKAWKPGMQHGQPVRVKYEIPINFQLAIGD